MTPRHRPSAAATAVDIHDIRTLTATGPIPVATVSPSSPAATPPPLADPS